MIRNLDEILPDFNEILKLIDDIKELEFKKVLLDLDIKTEISNVYTSTATDSAYYIGGKVASVSYIAKTWEHTGLDGGLIEKRKELENIKVELSSKLNKLQILKLMVEVWRTISANERVANI